MEFNIKSQIYEIQGKGDFITSLKYENQKDTLLMIHQQPKISIISDFSQKQMAHLQHESLCINFQSNVYDSLIMGDTLIESNKGMPVRVYTLDLQNKKQILQTTFYDKKISSEEFQSPLQFAKKNDLIAGGGKKFLTLYDIPKMTVKKQSKLNKKYISSLQFLSETSLIIGEFTGALNIFDIRSGDIQAQFKPHMDLVTKIKALENQQNYFVSLARKDNFSYLWDRRNLSTFTAYYELQLYENQRTGLQISQENEYLLLGSQKGDIFIHSLRESASQPYQLQTGQSKCVNSICRTKNGYINSIGSRQFSYAGQVSRGFLSYFTLG